MEGNTGDGLKHYLRIYFEEDAKVQAYQAEIDKIKSRQNDIQKLIHEFMKIQNLDEINVNNVRFSRVVKGPRKAKVKDTVLQGILMKHLSGEDGKVRDVLEDLAKARAATGSAETQQEVLVKRVLKRSGNVPV